ncbi:MAG: exodeoxyribonuclease VII small subunit [Lachnospiraceae bacterium]|nr:exodeoxyribonuclease VII small subunit [Lachnospiraceae bacterium]
MTIQETLNELDAITKRMSETDSLEQSFAEYEKGMKLIRECAAQITEIENKVRVLQEKPEQDASGDPADGE